MLTRREIRARFELGTDETSDDLVDKIHDTQTSWWDDGLAAVEHETSDAAKLFASAYTEGVTERERRVSSGLVVVGTLGDVNAPEYSGGYVFRRPDGTCFLEYTHGLECVENIDGHEQEEVAMLTVYQRDIELNVFDDLDWVDRKGIASFTGQEPSELLAAATGDNVLARAMVYQDVASYHGWHELDQYPFEITYGELCRRWQNLPEAE